MNNENKRAPPLIQAVLFMHEKYLNSIRILEREY